MGVDVYMSLLHLNSHFGDNLFTLVVNKENECACEKVIENMIQALKRTKNRYILAFLFSFDVAFILLWCNFVCEGHEIILLIVPSFFLFEYYSVSFSHAHSFILIDGQAKYVVRIL
jgi:hypothetical protein